MSTELLIQEPFHADVVFNDEKKADEVIAKVEKLAKEAVGTSDAATAEGRATLRSVAHKVTKSKTFVEAERKAYTADLVKRKRSVDQIGGKIWDGLERVCEEIRKPLTEWELKEAARIAAHDAAIAMLTGFSQFIMPEPTVAIVEHRMLEAEQLRRREWEEFDARAKEVWSAVRDTLVAALAAAQKREKDAAELTALRAEKEARDRAAAAEAARLEEERRARERKERKERLAAAAAEHARVQAEQAAARAIQEAKDAAELAERRRKVAEEAAALEATKAKERAEQEKQAAVEAERKRAAEAAMKVERERQQAEWKAQQERAEELRAAAARQANLEHCSEINRAVRAAIADALRPLCYSAGIHADMVTAFAHDVVVAIAKGQIPNVTINY